MKNLITLLSILCLAACTKEPSCNSDFTFKIIDTQTNQPAAHIDVEIEGFDYNQNIGGKSYLISKTFTTNGLGEIKIDGRRRINGWTYEVLSPYYDSKRVYVPGFDCDQVPVLDVTKLGKLHISVYDDPNIDYVVAQVIALNTSAVNNQATLGIGETAFIATRTDTTSKIRVFYRKRNDNKKALESIDIKMEMKFEDLNTIRIGV